MLRGLADLLFEYLAEVFRVVEPHHPGDIDDLVGGFQQLHRPLDPPLVHIGAERAAGLPLEEPAEVGGVDVDVPGRALEADLLAEVLIDEAGDLDDQLVGAPVFVAELVVEL